MRKRYWGPVFLSGDLRCKEDEALEDNLGFLTPTEKGTANLQLDQRLRYSVRDSDSFLWRGSSPHLIHQHQRPRGRQTYKEIQGIAEAQCLSTYRVSLHNLPSRWQTCSDSSPCRHRLKVAKAGNRVPYTDIHLRFKAFKGLADPRYSPETCILCGNKTSTHPHDRQEPNLPKVRTLAYARWRSVPER